MSSEGFRAQALNPKPEGPLYGAYSEPRTRRGQQRRGATEAGPSWSQFGVKGLGCGVGLRVEGFRVWFRSTDLGFKFIPTPTTSAEAHPSALSSLSSHL